MKLYGGSAPRCDRIRGLPDLTQKNWTYMKRSRISEEQITAILKEAEAEQKFGLRSQPFLIVASNDQVPCEDTLKSSKAGFVS
jgi:hypothetical protein